jgi:hypothetical protein
VLSCTRIASLPSREDSLTTVHAATPAPGPNRRVANAALAPF